MRYMRHSTLYGSEIRKTDEFWVWNEEKGHIWRNLRPYIFGKFFPIFQNGLKWREMPKKFLAIFWKMPKNAKKVIFWVEIFSKSRFVGILKGNSKIYKNSWSRNTSRFLKQSSKLSQLEDSGLRPRKIETGIGQLYQNLKTRLGHYIRFWAFFWKILILVYIFRNGIPFQVSSNFLLCVWGKNC